MNYQEGIEFMQQKCASGQGKFHPEGVPQITINYPGYKQRGDYRMEIAGQSMPPKHTDICFQLHNMVKEKQCSFEELAKLLADIYKNGTNIRANSYSIPQTEKLVSLIYWITLQDEINYPQPRFKGRRMPFSRYLEAAYCALPGCSFNLNEVLTRCDNKGYVPKPYDIPDAPEFYY